MNKQGCELCNNARYDTILIYDSYNNGLENLKKQSFLKNVPASILKKLQNFKNEKRTHIYICDECKEIIKNPSL